MKAPRTVWIVSEPRAETPQGCVWDLVGIFTSHEKAVKACTKRHHVVSPLPLDVRLPDETVTVKQSYRPLVEAAPSDILQPPRFCPREQWGEPGEGA